MLQRKNNDCGIAISSRIRLARNISEFPFPSRMNNEQGNEAIERVRNVILSSEKFEEDEFKYIDLKKLDFIDKQVLAEEHLISPELASSGNAGVFINKGKNMSIMINEEDHLRIQNIYSGINLDKAWDGCFRTSIEFEKNIDFAFNRRYGYLTSCPTNTGTGLRASVLLHLPALTMTGYIKGTFEICNKLGIAVRGLYGEHSEALGNMFQISNQVTLGHTEEEIINSVFNIINSIIEQEKTLRNQIYNQNKSRFEDKIFRSLGVFKNARIITLEESLEFISDIRLGIDMGIIEDIDLQKINKIIVLIQPANLQKNAGRELSFEERDIYRADVIRERFN